MRTPGDKRGRTPGEPYREKRFNMPKKRQHYLKPAKQKGSHLGRRK